MCGSAYSRLRQPGRKICVCSTEGEKLSFSLRLSLTSPCQSSAQSWETNTYYIYKTISLWLNWFTSKIRRDADFLWPSQWTGCLLPHPATLHSSLQTTSAYMMHNLGYMVHNLSYMMPRTHINRHLCLQFCLTGHIRVLCCRCRRKCVRQAAGCLCEWFEPEAVCVEEG